MNKIEKLRSAVIRAVSEAHLESGQVRINLKENEIKVTLSDADSLIFSYGQLIELYKMLQDLYGGE